MARWIRPETRRKIVEDRDDSSCVYCGARVVVGSTASGQGQAANAAELDHIICRSEFRSSGRKIDNRSFNLVTSCPACNNARKDTPIEDWCIEVAQRRLGADAGQSAIDALAEQVLITLVDVSQRPGEEIVCIRLERFGIRQFVL